MSFFKKIGDLLSDKQDNKGQKTKASQSSQESGEVQTESAQEQTQTQEPPIVEQPAKEKSIKEKPNLENEMVKAPLENKEELSRLVCEWLAEFSDKVGLGIGKQIVIWLDTDQLTFRTYDTEQYRQHLLSVLVNEYDIRVAIVAFRIGKPDEELRCTPIGQSGKVFLQVQEEKPPVPNINKKAAISIFGDAGSLLGEECILSSEDMKKKRISAYNIGAGRSPQLPSGYRQNHIAIDDNPASPMIQKNQFVSRKHAHIGFSEIFGFYLQVERDGTRMKGKRTRIFRGEQIIEMDNPQVKEPLQDGDLIELGKHVVLQYMEIE